jgi:ABC-2 type transport system permease protein
MIHTIKAEFRKLFSVRSTYIVSVLFLGLAGFIAFYVQGYRGELTIDSHYLFNTLQGSANTLALAGALIALLLLSHEYRYSTIIYTFTASNSRSKVLISKMLTILSFVFVYSLISSAIVLGLAALGTVAGGHTMPHQDINYFIYLAKSIFICEGYGLVGLLLVALIRNQVGAIAVLFIVPNTLESLLSLLLKHNSVYMPFTALSQVVQTTPTMSNGSVGHLSPPHGALVFSAYLIFGWIIAWILFLRRDAN